MQSNVTFELSATQAFEYQKAILAVLAKVEVGNCEGIDKAHIKTVYELLGKLNRKEFTISKRDNEDIELEPQTLNLDSKVSNSEPPASNL